MFLFGEYSSKVMHNHWIWWMVIPPKIIQRWENKQFCRICQWTKSLYSEYPAKNLFITWSSLDVFPSAGESFINRSNFFVGKSTMDKNVRRRKNRCQICHPTLSNLKKTHSSYFAKKHFWWKKNFCCSCDDDDNGSFLPSCFNLLCFEALRPQPIKREEPS